MYVRLIFAAQSVRVVGIEAYKRLPLASKRISTMRELPHVITRHYTYLAQTVCSFTV
jgi:hypothetical protein